MYTEFDIYVYIPIVGGLLIPEGIIRPVVGASALTCFIRCLYVLNLVPKYAIH